MTITIRTCDDWIAVYVDGQKVEANHSIDLRTGLRALGIDFVDEDYENRVNDLGELLDENGNPTDEDPFPEAI